jgi:NCS1 family nucleobase:cation symporter-1
MYRRVVSSANGFLSFLNGYSIFQGSVVGIVIVDYFFLRRGNLSLRDLFSQSSSGKYYYTKGVHLSGLVAFVVGFLLPLPGFIASFGTGADVSAAATEMFNLGWILSFMMGGLSYWIICTLLGVARHTKGLAFEEQVPHGDQDLIVDGMEIIGPTGKTEINEETKDGATDSFSV